MQCGSISLYLNALIHLTLTIHDYAEDDDDYAAGYQHFGKSGSAYTCSWECVETCVCDWLLNFVLRYV